MADIPTATKTAIMNDPAVQAEIKKAGENALNDPTVQAEIMRSAKQKGYEAVDMAKQFVSDPQVQEQAKAYAAQAGAYLGQAGGAFVAQIEQGPAGIRVLAFLAGISSFALGMYRVVISTISFECVTNPVHYAIAIYQIFLSITTSLFEASPEMIYTIQEKTGVGLADYQNMLIEKAKFISEAKGRGFFYVFQGSLWLSVASLTALPSLICGMALVFVGFLNLLIAYGMFEKVQTQVSSHYRKVSEGP
jgi:hypothetical protein